MVLVKKLLGGLLVYLAAVLLLTAILTPLGFWICHYFVEGVPVRRVFNRCLLIAALPLLWPLFRFWKIGSWNQLGWSGAGGFTLKNLILGLVFGMVVMGFLLSLSLILGERSMVPAESLHWGWKPLGFFLGVIPLGLVEETLFRGAFFLALLGFLKHRVWLWALIGSAFFATVHFTKAVNPSGEVDATVGFRILSEMTWTSWATADALPRWLTLLVFGLVLCALAYRCRGLGVAAGFHAGVVFLMKMGQHMTIDGPAGKGRWFDSDLVTGWAPMSLMAALLIGILISGHKKGRDERALS